MSKVLITGVAGLLGSHLSRFLTSQGHEVVGVDDISGGYIDFVSDNIVFYPNDICASTGVDRIFEYEKPDYVYHLAAMAAEGLSPFVRRMNYMQNVIASANIINASINHGVKKLIFTSSMAVYGDQVAPFSESDVPKPVDPYGIAKYAVEMDLETAHQQFGLDYSIVRPHNVVGVYQNIWDRYRNVIGIFIRQALAGSNLTVYGDGSQTRAFSDIDFYMKPFAKLMHTGSGQIYNIGAETAYSIKEVAELVIEVVENVDGGRLSPEIEFHEPRVEVAHAYCDHTKAINELGFVDNTKLYEVIQKMYLWARCQRRREVKNINYEISKGIYSYWKD